MSINFKWNLEKNKSLMKDRGVCFEDVVITIYEDKTIDTIKRPNNDKHSEQSICIVELMGYVCIVPYVKNDVDNYDDVLFETKLAAKNYLKKTKNINIRVAEYDMLMLKRKSAEVNIPYQTILSSLIHQYVENKVHIKL